MKTVTTVKLTDPWEWTITVDESNTQYDLKRNHPLFFETPHGKRETITVHRGCVIIRNTLQFTGFPPKRCTQVYLCGTAKRKPICWLVTGSNNTTVHSVSQGKQLINDYLNGTFQKIANQT